MVIFRFVPRIIALASCIANNFQFSTIKRKQSFYLELAGTDVVCATNDVGVGYGTFFDGAIQLSIVALFRLLLFICYVLLYGIFHLLSCFAFRLAFAAVLSACQSQIQMIFLSSLLFFTIKRKGFVVVIKGGLSGHCKNCF